MDPNLRNQDENEKQPPAPGGMTPWEQQVLSPEAQAIRVLQERREREVPHIKEEIKKLFNGEDKLLQQWEFALGQNNAQALERLDDDIRRLAGTNKGMLETFEVQDPDLFKKIDTILQSLDQKKSWRE